MPATETDPESGKPATDIRLRFAIIDAWAAEQQARGDSAIAELLGVDRTAVYRYRHGKIQPTLATAADIAAKVGVKLDDLIERVS